MGWGGELCWPETIGAIFLMEETQQIAAEKDFPNFPAVFFKADDFSAKGPPDKPLASLPEEPSVRADPSAAIGRRISPGGQRFRECARTGPIAQRRHPQA